MLKRFGYELKSLKFRTVILTAIVNCDLLRACFSSHVCVFGVIGESAFHSCSSTSVFALTSSTALSDFFNSGEFIAISITLFNKLAMIHNPK